MTLGIKASMGETIYVVNSRGEAVGKEAQLHNPLAALARWEGSSLKNYNNQSKIHRCSISTQVLVLCPCMMCAGAHPGSQQNI